MTKEKLEKKPRKNHWYEMYELECLKTKHLKEEIAQLEAQIEQLVYLHNEDVNTIKLLNKQIEKNAELKTKYGTARKLAISTRRENEKMKSDVLSLIKDRMNDDIDQDIIERLADKWERKEK